LKRRKEFDYYDYIYDYDYNEDDTTGGPSHSKEEVKQKQARAD